MVAFALFAPLALIALPVAVLLASSRPRRIREWVVAGAAAGFAVAWLLVPGGLPDQVLRAGAVIATATFVPLTLRTNTWFIHRALVAAGVTTLALLVLVPLSGTSWGGVRWWVEHDAGLAARTMVGTLWAASGTGVEAHPVVVQLQQGFEQVVTLLADLYPALLVLQIIAGFALAIAVYRRVAIQPRGRALGRFTEFHFSEHLGWAAVLPLVVLLIPALTAAKTAAANLLLVTGALYTLRGLAVAVFGLSAAGVGGALSWLLIAIGVFLLLPVAMGGVIVLGVIDARVDLRRRWRPSP